MDDLSQIPTPGFWNRRKVKTCRLWISYSIKITRKTDNIVLEQFNLRALVNSEQDGFGNNWDYEQFNLVMLMETLSTVFQQQGTKGTFAIGSNSFDLQHDYPSLFLSSGIG